MLVWCVVCTGACLQACTRLVRWSGVYALDGYVVGVMYLLDYTVASVIQKPTLNDNKCSDYGWVYLTSS